MSDLKKIKIPTELNGLDNRELTRVAGDIRSYILQVTKSNGGHLSSNLGIVETTVALHSVFDFSKDKLIFDVGHQCYAHKILTDRAERFKSIRLDGGISGFPDRDESPYDSFSTGHAGTSISASLGMCEARDKLGQDYTVVVVVGDGSMVNGLNLEALSASTHKPKNYIVILNDNGMSISKNGNGFYKIISKSTTNKGYVKGKSAVKKVFGDSFIGKFFRKIRNFFKRSLNRNNYFENFGFKYVGVIDGNDIKEMTKILKRVKYVAKSKAVLLHIKTTKGKGLEVAEESADLYHGVGKDYKIASGNMGRALGQKLCQVISEDKRVVAITAAMKNGTGLELVEEKHPSNFFDVGIAEEFAVTYAAGMASGGLKPVVAVYSTFMQRAYDQILHDVCMQNLPVVFCLDRAGFVGQDGKTHQGLFDLSYLSHLPNLTVLSPINPLDLQNALDYALSLNSPVAIRYSKDGCESEFNSTSYSDGLWQTVKEGTDVTVLAVGGRMLDLALEFAKASDKSVKVVAVRSVKPLSKELLQTLSGKVVTLEENVLNGGFGSSVRAGVDGSVAQGLVTLGVDDRFIKHGSIQSQMCDCGLSVEKLLCLTK